MSDTELKLKHWRGDQLGSERLAAAILHLEGFSAVDPQCPLGGPDGLKDVLCEKNDWKYVAAAYFPASDQKFQKTRKKFIGDLAGVAAHKADGIVFITNQVLTPGERVKLHDLASAKGHKSLVYHLERLRAILDSPGGYGVRLEFLQVPLSLEEQLSFFSRRESSLAEALREHTATVLAELGRRFDRLEGKDDLGVVRMPTRGFATPQTMALSVPTPPPSDKKPQVHITVPGASDQLTVPALCMLHEALLFDSPGSSDSGRLRSISIWIGPPGAGPDSATYTPPPPQEVSERIQALFDQWNQSFGALKTRPKPEVLAAIVRFHHEFLQIHPFLDGNGRVARYLLMQHARALLGEQRPVVIKDRVPYFVALRQADAGDIGPLTELLTQAIYGEEFIAGSPCQMSGQACPRCRTGTMEVTGDGNGVECAQCGLYVPA